MDKTLRERIEAAAEQPLKLARYIFRRYHLPFCLVLISSSKEIDIKTLPRFLRQTDKSIKIDDSHYIIFLALVGEKNGGYKAAENILNKLESLYPDVRFHIGIACKDREVQQDIITRVIYALSNAEDHEENFVADDYGID